MDKLIGIRPTIRSAHYYSHDGRNEERGRKGYCYAFHLYSGGSGAVAIGEREHPLSAGTLVFIPPGVTHGFLSRGDAPLATYNLYADLWGEPRVPGFGHLTNSSEWNRDLATEERQSTELDGAPTISFVSQGSFLYELFVQICHLFNRQTLYERDEVVRSLFCGWLRLWMESWTSPTTSDARIAKAIQQLDQYQQGEIDYDKLREASGLRGTQFYTLFKQQTGMSPVSYIAKVKMERAKVLLTESSRTVTAIAERLGYSSVHYFTRQFTAHYGVSPGEYRRNRRRIL